MTNDVLMQKRSHLLRDFDLNFNSFLVARAVLVVDRAIRRVTKHPQPLRFRYLSAFILLSTLLPGLLIAWARGEAATFRIVGWAWILGVTVSTLGALCAYHVACFVLNCIKQYLLDVQDVNDLEDLHGYMQKLWFPAHPYLRMFLPVVIWGIFASVMFSYVAGTFAGIGVVIGTLVFGFNLGIGFDFLIWMIGLPGHIGRYHYVLNNVDPSSSEVVFRITNLFNKVMYAYAAYFTVTTVAIIAVGQATYIAVPVVLSFWVILTIQFIATQSGLKNIITTAKWNTLNNIQADIRALQTSGKLMQKETTDAINRLMDLHERIRSTPNSTMNVRTTLNFLNQLFLPILGAILSYLDSILDFLHLR